MKSLQLVDFVFDGPPSEPAAFVECETQDGASVRVGEWLRREDGYWVLRAHAVVDTAPPELDHSSHDNFRGNQLSCIGPAAHGPHPWTSVGQARFWCPGHE